MQLRDHSMHTLADLENFKRLKAQLASSIASQVLAQISGIPN